jgi:hypothetical protein
MNRFLLIVSLFVFGLGSIAAQKTNPVNLIDLLLSKPDQHSPLSGKDLLALKQLPIAR